MLFYLSSFQQQHISTNEALASGCFLFTFFFTKVNLFLSINVMIPKERIMIEADVLENLDSQSQ